MLITRRSKHLFQLRAMIWKALDGISRLSMSSHVLERSKKNNYPYEVPTTLKRVVFDRIENAPRVGLSMGEQNVRITKGK